MKNALILLFFSLFALRSEGATPEGVDSTLYIYYTWCNDHISERAVLEKSDTLFRMSEEKGDVRMQTVALSIRADYYYHTNNLDSLKAEIDRVKQFARTNDQLKYYYFSWNRLVLYYIKRMQYGLAQYELQQLLEKAAEDDYKQAMGQAYQQMAHIYRLKKSYGPSLEYYLKAVDYIEQNDPEYYSLHTLYIHLAEAYTSLEEYDRAAEALEKALVSVRQPDDAWIVKTYQAANLARKGKCGEAFKLLSEIERNTTSVPFDALQETRYVILKRSGDYPKALETLNEHIAQYRRRGVDESLYHDKYYTRAELYALTGNYMEAYNDLTHYIGLGNKQTETYSQRTLEEFATLLDVNRLDREKAQFQQQAQAERLRRNRTLIVSLAFILLLASVFLVMQTLSNRRLERAKRAAEESDRMKGIFIRTITHEINTPLNAIVGFSELAATSSSDDEDRQSYIGTIRENSGLLQKLVDDVLYIADIESTDEMPACKEMDIDHCCRRCIEEVRNTTADCPEIRFTGGGKQTVQTSNHLVSKVIHELLLNAVRFAPEGPVTLTYRVEEGKLIFTVTDSGQGIPAVDAERIFDRFVKLDAFSQGLGLGLGVCRLIATTLKGNIYLDTSCTKGARFVFTIPVA